jgi:hypothetical protein
MVRSNRSGLTIFVRCADRWPRWEADQNSDYCALRPRAACQRQGARTLSGFQIGLRLRWWLKRLAFLLRSWFPSSWWRRVSWTLDIFIDVEGGQSTLLVAQQPIDPD